MPEIPGSIEEIDVRISKLRDGLRQLVEQAAATRAVQTTSWFLNASACRKHSSIS
jgi:hypothetical protein